MISSILIYTGSAILAVFGIIILLAFSFRRVVPTNMVHIVQRAGQTVAYGRGKESGNVYYAWPSFLPIIGIDFTTFPESNFQVPLSDYPAYDVARLPFVVDIVSFFRVSNAETVAQRVSSFTELHEQLTAIMQGSIRSILAKNTLESIMQERAEFGEQFTQEIDHQLEEWGVCTVKSIELMDIRDADGSRVIQNIMAKEQSRIQMESRVEVANNGKIAQTKEIEAKRAVEVSMQDAEKSIGVRTAEKDREIGLADEKSKQDIAESAATTAERDMAVQKVNDVKSAEIQRDTEVIAAESVKKVAILEAEGSKQEVVLTAEANRDAALLQAEGIEKVGMAEAAIEEAMLQAPVTTQINLAHEIGSNEGYQSYLTTIRHIEAIENVGKENAQALSNADLKIISNAGDVNSGVSGMGDILSTKGGLNIAGALEALVSTEAGKNLAEKFLAPKS